MRDLDWGRRLFYPDSSPPTCGESARSLGLPHGAPACADDSYGGVYLGWLDWTVIAAYAAAVLIAGQLAARGHAKADDLLVGGRSIPTWAVLGSMIATELSAATFLGVPDAAYSGTWSYLELAFGALLGKLAISLRVIPLYHRLGVVSIYQLLEDRFGRRAQRAAAGCFVVGRLMASGVRLFIAALAFSTVTGTSLPVAILACGVVAGIYTRAGGIRSVIWTDVLQAFVFLAGASALLLAAAASVDGGFGAIWEWASAQGRSDVFTFAPFFSLTDGRGFGTALVGGFFLTLATHGTDHDMVQRLLAARGGREGGLALSGSALLNFPLTALFLAVGTAIAASHALAPPTYEMVDSARVVPTFALHALPVGVRGVVFAGLFAAAMSSLDSAICAIATTWTVDLAREPALSNARGDRLPGESGDSPAAQRGLDSRVTGLAARTRRASVLATGGLVVSALAMAGYHAALAAGEGVSLVEFALSAMTILYGGLLGVFAIAILAPGVGSERSAVAGLATGAVLGLALFLHPLILGETWLAWTWWIPVSATAAATVTAFGKSAARLGKTPSRVG